MGKSIDIGASEFNPATSVTPIESNTEVSKCCYYTLDGRYMGNIRPALPGIYIMKTMDKNKLLHTKKIIIK